MFERFTDRARRVVVLAQQEARLLNHNYIGTEHILLGLISEGEGVAAKALESLGISIEAVRGKVESIIGVGSSTPSGHIPFTPRAKKVLELSLREALQLGHNYIGTEHVLLGLIREGEGVAAQVLVNLGADLSAVRQAVIQELSGYASRARPPSALERPPQTPAMLKAGAAARRMAMGRPVGSQHQLLALLADEQSLAAKALAQLGVTREAVEATLNDLDAAGTSDETPEEAGARRIAMRVEGKLLMLEIDDPELAESLQKAMKDRMARIIKGTDPEAELAGFPQLWSAVSRTVEDLTRRLPRMRSRASSESTEWRPPGWHQGGHAAVYWIARTPGGVEGNLEVSDADPAALRAWLHQWLTANGLGFSSSGDVAALWAYVDRAGDAFTVSSFGFGADGPPGAEAVPLGTLVHDALDDLAA